MFGLLRQMGITDGGENGLVAEVFLYFEQIDACLDQVGCEGMAQRMWRDLFFTPQLAATWCSAAATPLRSSGAVAHAPLLAPPARLGNNSTGLRFIFQ